MKKGSTLIELLVVIAIVGLLTTIAIVGLRSGKGIGEMKLDCDNYKFYSQKDLPAGCINYFK